MFQYAAGRALSLALGQPLLLDLRGFKSYPLHQGFELGDVFTGTYKAATSGDVRKILGWRSPDIVRKALKRMNLPFLTGASLALEPHFNYWPGLRAAGGSRYLMGYWQSEMYFKDIAETLRSDFHFKLPLDHTSRDIADCMQACQAVSLHVRRGDYLTHAPTAKVLSVCSLDYYRQAIAYISTRVETPHFYLFSDDMDWVKATLDIPFNKTYVEHNRRKYSYRDMHLMHLCKHHIIANSSFSWWGAWLNQNPHKLVIAPRDWFCSGINDADLIPEDWIRL